MNNGVSLCILSFSPGHLGNGRQSHRASCQSVVWLFCASATPLYSYLKSSSRIHRQTHSTDRAYGLRMVMYAWADPFIQPYPQRLLLFNVGTAISVLFEFHPVHPMMLSKSKRTHALALCKKRLHLDTMVFCLPYFCVLYLYWISK